MRHAPVAAVAQKQHKALKIRSMDRWLPVKPLMPRARLPHPRRHFAQPLHGVLGKAQVTQVLPVGAVAIVAACSVLPDFAQVFVGEQLAV